MLSLIHFSNNLVILLPQHFRLQSYLVLVVIDFLQLASDKLDLICKLLDLIFFLSFGHGQFFFQLSNLLHVLSELIASLITISSNFSQSFFKPLFLQNNFLPLVFIGFHSLFHIFHFVS